jgi:nitrous oxidase accessory protein
VAEAAPGQVLRVRGGWWRGPLVIERPLTLVGEEWPVVDGGGRGTVITVRAPGVVLRGLAVRASGTSLDEENSGIAVEAPGAVVRGNRLEEVLFGIYLRDAPGSEITGNRIAGKALAIARRGDAVRVWHSDGVTIAGNRVAGARDVVLWYSSDLTVRDNRVRNGRYGLHFMYCDDATIAGNLLYGNSVGAFLMYSRRLRLEGNTIAANRGPSGYGVGLKDMDDATVGRNLLAGNRVGVFLDNSPRESTSRSLLTANLVAGNDAGLLLMPNVRRAEVAGNSFVENGVQVAIGGGGGDAGANLWRANFWSDYAGFDADGDGHGDLPYRAERLFEAVADRRPELRLFAHGPAAEALDFAARAFPAVRPQPKLVDPEPLMRPRPAAGVPPLPDPGGGWRPAAAGLLAGALALLALPLIGPGLRGARPRAAAVPSRRGEPLIRARGVSRRFGRRLALDDFDLEVQAGESVALWGPNGAGKTTALRALLGLLRCSGSIAVAGHDPWRQGKKARSLIGYLPQEIAFQGELSVAETLELFARLRRAGDERCQHLLAWLELEAHRDKPVGALSGGLKQRLALGVALLADPPILLLDEPTANLDPAARDAFLTLLRRLRKNGKTLVFSSHRSDEIRALADRVLVLAEGRLERSGPVDEIELEGATTVELRLRLSERDSATATGVLTAEGYEPRRSGPWLVLDVATRRKAAVLVLLLKAGLTVDDFEVVAAVPAGDDE